mmetsp:Transcript_140534/g.449161  ORF Transcript_140534/g.449161 Transcript_140534/m.449161 type:complete len:299 (+) Transcript_140534:1966-2862(+)
MCQRFLSMLVVTAPALTEPRNMSLDNLSGGSSACTERILATTSAMSTKRAGNKSCEAQALRSLLTERKRLRKRASNWWNHRAAPESVFTAMVTSSLSESGEASPGDWGEPTSVLTVRLLSLFGSSTLGDSKPSPMHCGDLGRSFSSEASSLGGLEIRDRATSAASATEGWGDTLAHLSELLPELLEPSLVLSSSLGTTSMALRTRPWRPASCVEEAARNTSSMVAALSPYESTPIEARTSSFCNCWNNSAKRPCDPKGKQNPISRPLPPTHRAPGTEPVMALFSLCVSAPSLQTTVSM